MNITNLLELLIEGQNLDSSQINNVISACMRGELTDIQLAAFLVLMRMKGETAEELTAAARCLLNHALPLNLGHDLIDIVGTGGDGKHTFNISTISSIVSAAAGARVAKHGSYAVSSSSGSVDLLQTAGIPCYTEESSLKQSLSANNICFLAANYFHPALKQARNTRSQLGLRTLFNLLGPLVNPARVKKQVVGVFLPHLQPLLLEVLINLGSERAMVVCSTDGLDEVSIAAPTRVLKFAQGEITDFTINPRDYDCYHRNLNDIVAHSPTESLTLIEGVLQNKTGAARDIVLLNSGLALYCAGLTPTYTAGVELASEALSTGKAAQCFENLKQRTAR